MPKQRLDLLLVERGLAESRSKAQALVMAGQVFVNGEPADKSAATFPANIEIDLKSGPRFVSRGGEKLNTGLTAFNLDVSGLVCADIGASTGGFTDCLLQRDARRVYAVDVGKGILHWKIRSDPRVIVMEETNARYIDTLPEPIGLVVIDASFISLKILLPVVKGWLQPSPVGKKRKEKFAAVIALIKPQFEAGRRQSARGKGVIRDVQVHRTVLTDLLSFAQAQGFSIRGLMRSPLLGPKGNVEFLAWWVPNQPELDATADMVERVLTG